MAQLHLAAQRFDAAIGTGERAIERDPEDAQTYYNLGSAYGSRKRFADAERCFLRFVELDPDRKPRAWIDLAQTQIYQQRLADAVRTMERAVSAHPERREFAQLLEQLRARAGNPGAANAEKDERESP